MLNYIKPKNMMNHSYGLPKINKSPLGRPHQLAVADSVLAAEGRESNEKGRAFECIEIFLQIFLGKS